METEEIPYQLLHEITNGFSEIIGAGSFGVVYKGVTKHGKEVAVKKLRNDTQDIGYKQFQNELYNLMKVKHKNIVHLMGYCYDIEKTSVVMDGRKVPVEETHRALCFEYLHNGSLQNYLSEKSCELDWHIWYKIIEGICDGLKHIHEELEEPLYHLDLKPGNILLDKNMVPKIADFGLSRIFGDERTWTTESNLGTLGFQPPEYIDKGEVSKKFDIFSLGVIIKRIVSEYDDKHDCYFEDLSLSANEFIDQVTNGWRKKLQETYCSESLLEKYCNQVEKCTRIALRCTKIDSRERPTIMEIIDSLNETATGIVEVLQIPCKGCHVDVSGMSNHTNTMDMLECYQEYFDVSEELIVGRIKEKNEIINLLKGITQNFVILPIYGIGGIGKTTFARMIYRDTNFKNYTQVWVDVQDRFDVTQILNSIISQLRESENKSNGRQMTNKNIFIVLDDLWEDNPVKLDELKESLYNHDSNTIVLVTTRNEWVAKKLCTNLMSPYKIEFLTDDMCWDIIKQRSGFETRDDKEYLLDIGRDIAQKCGGVALAAKTLGFTLKPMTSYQWKEVNDCDIWNESIPRDISMPDHVFQSLKISYERMDTYLNLKLCFKYCGMFPKGHKIVKDDLIYQWISLGFIRPTQMMSIMQVSEKYILQLLGLSFLEHSIPPQTYEVMQTYKAYGEHDTVFTMHDLVHDLAISVLGDEILDQSNKQGSNARGKASPYCPYQYALLNNCSSSLKLWTTSPERLRALRFVGCVETELCGAAFAPAHSLQVLDISNCSIHKLPGCIGELKQLRYLNAPGIQDQMLPECITKLCNLMYLILGGSPTILALPDSIGEMESLVHLDLSGCRRIGELPESFGELRNLEYVDFAECFNVKGISQYLSTLTKLQYLNLSYCQHIGHMPSALASLIELHYLNLSNSSYLWMNEDGYAMEYLSTLTKLRYLDLSVSKISSFRVLPESFGRLTELRYLNLSGHSELVRLPRSFVNLSSLVHLDLSECVCIRNVPAALNGLTKLQYLRLNDCSAFKYTHTKSLQGLQEVLGNLSELRCLCLGDCFQSIFGEQPVYEDSFLDWISTCTNLEYLDLSGNIYLFSLPETLGNLRRLHTLNLSMCAKLQRLPASITEIDSLRFLYTYGCDSLDKSTLPHYKNSSTNLMPTHFFVHAAGDGESCSNLFQLEDENPPFLELSMLENVMSAEEAQRIRLVEKKNIRDLGLVWTRDARRFVGDTQVLRELEPPNSVRVLRLQGYNGTTFPTWMTVGLVTYLPRLIAIYMVDIPNCNKLPPFGQLPNLGLLQINQMDSIRKIDDDLYGGRRPFPRLENFQILNMKCLEVWSAPSSTSSAEDGLQISQVDMENNGMYNLEFLYIADCPKLRFKGCPPQGHYAQFEMLVVRSDQVLLSSWGASGSCTHTRVRRLLVSGFQTPLHQWSILRHLPCLEKLYIEDSSDLTCSSSTTIDLFGGLSASLLTLSLEKCDDIASVPEWVGDLTSLRTLKIRNCQGIQTLPESIQQLTNLQRLKITACPHLHLWKEPMDKLRHIKEIEIDGERLLSSSSRYLMAYWDALRWLVLLGEKRHTVQQT